MIRGLIEKELRQHALALFFILLLVVAGAWVIWLNRSLQAVLGSPFGAVRFLLLTFVPLAGLILGQTLIVGEYRNKTQLFLEGLPLPRWKMIAIKYGLGLVLILASIAVVFAIAWQRSLHSDAMTPRFALLLALRSGCFVWFIWSLCFAHGFMGRYRILFGVTAITIVKMNIVIHNVDLAAHGPFELTGDRFAYERYVAPVTELLVTAGYAIFWTGIGFLLGLGRDATIASALAQRMSSREKIVLTFGIFGLVMTLATLDERSKPITQIHLPGAVEITRGAAQVAAAAAVDQPTTREEAALRSAAERMAGELSGVAAFLNTDEIPPVFIVHRRDLKDGALQSVRNDQEHGIIVRANLTDPKFDADALTRSALREMLLAKSLGRLNLERNSWVLDGFVHWWLTRAEPLGKDARELHLARGAVPKDFSEKDLDRWLTLRKEIGNDKACALAATGLRVLQARHGAEGCRRFLASVLGRSVQKDARPWLRDIFYPVSVRFRSALAVSIGDFTVEWRDALRDAATPPPAVPAP